MDFFAEKNADLNLEKSQLRLLTAAKFKHSFESQGTRQARGKASHGALTIFVNRNGDYSREEPIAKARRGEGKCEQESKQRPLEIDIWEGESWIVKTTETIKQAPWVKQLLGGWRCRNVGKAPS